MFQNDRKFFDFKNFTSSSKVCMKQTNYILNNDERPFLGDHEKKTTIMSDHKWQSPQARLALVEVPKRSDFHKMEKSPCKNASENLQP